MDNKKNWLLRNSLRSLFIGGQKANAQQTRLRRAWKANDEADVVRNR